jgi:hypothetical protein
LAFSRYFMDIFAIVFSFYSLISPKKSNGRTFT